jgi:hypothetical protein
MLRWNRTNKTMAALTALGIYFALAAWSKWTWVDPMPKGKVVVRLDRPFEVHLEHGVSCYQLRGQEVFESVADSADDPTRSPLLVYEDDHLLGPAHSRIEDIGRLGQGRYSHSTKGLVFSASDNSDVNTSKHLYWAVLPN